ncbi:unnamed protein product [Euphydryas editha]|uniref:Rad21/Rec8-like protein N-terminal domain-containing protein n=1 Tax=Euphydryas editha TaxID=104508 RepID=A0AAU9V0T2_EUPED|nr:unnamed protein product [Euphydryas editha]
MFYDYNLMTNSELGVVWRYANRQKGVSDNVGIPKICSTIDELIDYDSSRKNRLSLRTSALLLNGTAHLYKEELDKLYQDCIQLNSQMLSRRTQDTSLTDDNNSGSISEENLRSKINN